MMRRRAIALTSLLLMPSERPAFARQAQILDEASARHTHALFASAVAESRWPTVLSMLSEYELAHSEAPRTHRAYIEGLRAASVAGVRLRAERALRVTLLQVSGYQVAQVEAESFYSHPMHGKRGYRQRHVRLLISDGGPWRFSIASCPPETVIQALQRNERSQS